MRKQDYAILAAAIKKHGPDTRPDYDYPNDEQALGAKQCAERIARTFARFASVNKTEFLKACGIE